MSRMLSIWSSLQIALIFSSVSSRLTELNGMIEIKADNNFYYIGENITLHCYSQQPVSDITFVYNKDIPVPQEYITVVNETYAFMQIVLNESYHCFNMFYCKNGNTFLGYKEIYLEYPPQNVTDLKYEYYDQEDFKASWNLRIDSYRCGMATEAFPNSTTVISAEYAGSEEEDIFWKNCNKSTTTSCIVYDVHDLTEISLRVNITNLRRNDTVTTLFSNLYLDNRVRPAPVTMKKPVILNSTCGNVSWTSKKHYSKFKVSGNATNTTTSKNKVTICELHPFYNYTVIVQALPLEGYPSKKRSAILHMPQDAPASGPGLIDGGFYRDSCVARGGYQNQTVYIYFKPVKLEHRNGLIINYTANLTTESQTTASMYSLSNPENNSLSVSVPCGKGFVLNMYAATHVGYSPATNFQIPAADKVAELRAALHKMDLHIKESGDDGSVKTAYWLWKPEFVIDHLVLYYCERKTSFTRACNEKMPMEKIDVNPADQNKTFIAKKADLFGLASSAPNGIWTGIIFTDCIYTDFTYSHNLEVPAPPAIVQDVEHIKLSWKQEKCDMGKRLLTYYSIVKWCSSSTCRYDNVTIMDASVYTISDVTIGTEYLISVAAITSRGETGYSKPVKVTVRPPKGLQFVTKIITGVSSTVLLLVLLMVPVLLYLCRHKWKKARQKFTASLLLPVPSASPYGGDGSLYSKPHDSECRYCETRADSKTSYTDAKRNMQRPASFTIMSPYTDMSDTKNMERPASYTIMSLGFFKPSCDQVWASTCKGSSPLCFSTGLLSASIATAAPCQEHSELTSFCSDGKLLDYPHVKEDFVGSTMRNTSGKMQSKLQNNFANEDLTQPPNEATKGDDTHPSICVTAGYVWPDLLFESRRPSIASAIEYDDKENVNSAQEKRDKGMRTEADVSNSPCKSADLSIYVNVKELALDRYVQAFSAVEENRHEVCSEEPFKNTTQALDHTSDFQGLTMQDCLQREAKTAETGMKATG
ncbi:uncharacterized protein LOC112573107 isoform X2 [Pomacea canaliculata]|nr:uncharacterized protein LOC112573107 isoform X2 [Pomacea canaliculata]XP_025108930.1 uncharacterized protein LOC112573107 isoform X2 [Pomacea canaliculata]